MKSARWYLMHEGKKLLAATRAEAAHLAQLVADATGKPVAVRSIDAPKAKKPAKRPAARSAPARRTMKRNPDPGSYLPLWNEQRKAKEARTAYLDATKARRLAKGMRGRGRGQGAIRAQEAGAAKTARFAVDVANAKEAYTLFRASRSAAERLASEFLAARYKVKVREV